VVKEYKSDFIDRQNYSSMFAAERVEGRIEGEIKGRIEGEIKGEIKGRIEMILKMFDKAMSIEQIADIAKLSEEDVKDIIESQKSIVLSSSVDRK
jgi:predicted transposase/invertase (TIGR01784 family)